MTESLLCGLFLHRGRQEHAAAHLDIMSALELRAHIQPYSP